MQSTIQEAPARSGSVQPTNEPSVGTAQIEAVDVGVGLLLAFLVVVAVLLIISISEGDEDD